MIGVYLPIKITQSICIDFAIRLPEGNSKVFYVPSKYEGLLFIL